MNCNRECSLCLFAAEAAEYSQQVEPELGKERVIRRQCTRPLSSPLLFGSSSAASGKMSRTRGAAAAAAGFPRRLLHCLYLALASSSFLLFRVFTSFFLLLFFTKSGQPVALLRGLRVGGCGWGEGGCRDRCRQITLSLGDSMG